MWSCLTEKYPTNACEEVWGRRGEGRGEGSTEKHNSSTDAFYPLRKFNFRSFFVRQAFSKIGPLLSVVIAKKKDPKKPGKYDKEQQSIGILTTFLSP